MLAHLWPDSLFAAAGAVRPAGAARAAADTAVVDTALVQGD
jgi:hypothetical protein